MERMPKPVPRLSRCLLLIAFYLVTVVASFAEQNITLKRGQAEGILDKVADEVRKNYYDPKLNGVNWDVAVLEAKKKIELATSMNQAFANIAAMLDTLNDSHTFFIPPPRSFSLDYGWRIQSVGERCFVTRVRPETDAAAKVKPGDEVLDINGYKPTRANIPRIKYVLNVLRPQSKIQIVVRSISGEERQLEIKPRIVEGQLITPSVGPTIADFRLAWERERKHVEPRWRSLSDDVLVAQIPEFLFDKDEADKLIREARKHKAVILDLRGNHGGREDSLNLLVGEMFDHQVKVADVVTRAGTKPRTALLSRHPYTGKLIVLVDSGSMSAAEMFARIIQIEKRGLVIGDRTLGMVMESQLHPHVAAGLPFAVSVTEANLILSDGKSLEHIGVVPDELLLPSADDIAADKDPVLAHAAESLGVELSPSDAAKLFPYEWLEPPRFSGH